MIQIRQSSRLIRQGFIERRHERRIRLQAMQQQASLRRARNPHHRIRHRRLRFGLVFNQGAVID